MRLNFSEINWQLILIIAAISMTVSYVGDVLGMKIGKKRISLFGLRPKYTSTVITILTGLGVALLTLAFAAAMSPSIQGAFFGVNYLDRQISALTQNLSERQNQLSEMEMEVYYTQQELERLRDEAEDLKKSLAEMKGGKVIAFQGELLAQAPVEGDSSSAVIDAAFARLIQTAEETLSLKVPENAQELPTKVEIGTETRRRIAAELASAKERKVLRLSAPSNIVQGQVVEGVVQTHDSRTIYKKDEVLKRETIRGDATPEQAADLLYSMLKHINRSAVGDGVLPDPISGAVGNMDSLVFYDLVDRISEASGVRDIVFLAATDIYTEGPVNVRVEISDRREGTDR